MACWEEKLLLKVHWQTASFQGPDNQSQIKMMQILSSDLVSMSSGGAVPRKQALLQTWFGYEMTTPTPADITNTPEAWIFLEASDAPLKYLIQRNSWLISNLRQTRWKFRISRLSEPTKAQQIVAKPENLSTFFHIFTENCWILGVDSSDRASDSNTCSTWSVIAKCVDSILGPRCSQVWEAQAKNYFMAEPKF